MGKTKLPRTHPLPVATEQDNFERQQSLVSGAMQCLPDNGLFRSDVGVNPPLGRPQTTANVEEVLSGAFGAEAAAFVQGAGTGAIRSALQAGPWKRGERRLIIHDAPLYSTTRTTFEAGLVEPIRVDYNDLDNLRAVLAQDTAPDWLYLQHTRQQLQDSYDPEAIIRLANDHGKRVVVDDNYAVLRTPKIGVELGASASCFSLFKLHGPEGVGIVVGDQDIVESIRSQNYSGGGQVQGHQAIWALQSLIEGCLNWAYSSRATLEVAERLQAGEIPQVRSAQVGNLQDLCVLVELDGPIADAVRARAGQLGAATYPVGSNSRYEVAPMIYRMSGSSLEANPELATRTLRVNPMRAGANTVLNLLKEAISSCS